MSDGPHKSLPMRPGWQKVAEAADNAATSADEIAEKIPAALRQDWNQEVPGRLLREIVKTLNDDQAVLFPGGNVEILEALRAQAAGAPLGGILLDHAIEVAASGYTGVAAVTEAIGGTLMDRARSSSRQVEEHYHRKASRDRSVNVRSRIEEGVRQAPIGQLARELAGENKVSAVSPPQKRSGVDDGVKL